MRNKIIEVAKTIVDVDYRETRTITERVFVQLFGTKPQTERKQSLVSLHYIPSNLHNMYCDVNVRSISFNHLYADAMVDVYGDLVELASGYTVKNFIEDLRSLRKEYKVAYVRAIRESAESMQENARIQKALKVILCSFVTHAVYAYDYGMSYNAIVSRAHMIMRDVIQDIAISGGVFMVADVDTIIYGGEYIDVPNYDVHYDTHTAVIIGNNDVSYHLVDGRLKSRFGNNTKRCGRAVARAVSETYQHFCLNDGWKEKQAAKSVK